MSIVTVVLLCDLWWPEMCFEFTDNNGLFFLWLVWLVAHEALLPVSYPYMPAVSHARAGRYSVRCMAYTDVWFKPALHAFTFCI